MVITLKDRAKLYTPTKTKVISELSEVSMDAEIKEAEKTNDEGEQYSYSYLEVNEEEYRVPPSVLGQIKELLEENPNLKKFRVKKQGEGLKTRYTTIPLG